MASVTIQTQAGKSTGKAELVETMFGVEPNMAVMHQVVTAQLAARRAGTHSTKTRSEVRGGGAKPWRQKGTGRSRAGTTRAPGWVGGGIAHGPKPRDYSQKTPKKMIKLALASALSDRAADGNVTARAAIVHAMGDIAQSIGMLATASLITRSSACCARLVSSASLAERAAGRCFGRARSSASPCAKWQRAPTRWACGGTALGRSSLLPPPVHFLN